MKLSHLISIILISALVGIASNLSYSFLTTERPSQDEIDFKNLLDEDWEHTLQENPYFASLLGDLRFNNKVSSNSSEKFKSDANYERAFLDKLDKIKLSNLNDSDQLNYRLIKTSMEVSLEGRNFPRYYMALNQRGGVQDYYSYGDRLNFSNKTDYEDWFERIKGFNENVKNSLINNREGLEMGYTQPKLVTRAVVSQIESLLASSMEDHPITKYFYLQMRS